MVRRRLRGDAVAVHTEGDEQGDDTEGAEQAEFLAGEGEDKVRVRLRQKVLLHAVAEAHPEKATAAKGDQRLRHLEAGALRVSLAHKGQDALQLIGGGQHRDQGHHRTEAAGARQMRGAGATEPEQDERNRANREGGAQIGLQYDEHKHQADDEESRRKAPLPVRHLPFFA